jgi:hypothetical protein
MSKVLTQTASPACDPEHRKRRSVKRWFQASSDWVGTEAKLALPDLNDGSSRWVTIKASATNRGYIWVGRVGVTPDTGFELTAGDEIEFEVTNLSSIYVVGNRSEQSYCWLIN